jgi:hypothetical protein
MKIIRKLPLLLLAGSALMVAPLAPAQSVGQQLGQVLGQFFGTQNEAASEDQLRSFNRFLQHNEDIANDLWRRPELVNDPRYVDHHPDLGRWMNDHREAAEALRSNPDAFMDRERHFQTYDQDFSSGNYRRGELAHFDWFLDNHPEIRSDLMQRPELALNDDYLDRHQDLREYLDRHPEVRNELRDHPQEFMHREQRLENRQAEYRSGEGRGYDQGSGPGSGSDR